MSLPDLPDHPSGGLREEDLDPNPFRQFGVWLEQALAAGLPQPNGMTLATATPAGQPSARMVLLRGFDERGFCFFTNFASRKAQDLAGNPLAALVFYWPDLDRQVRIEGSVEVMSSAESDRYFATRPRDSQLSAWASPQSEVIASREALVQKVEELATRYPQEVPRPPHWGGYRVVPTMIEFWEGRPGRLHDRLRYRRLGPDTWRIERLAP